jgi:type II secretory pathway pseudopilin PulG
MIAQTWRGSKIRARCGQKGYLLLSVMLLITVMLIALAIETPRIVQQIKREKEEELVHRGKEYANAIKKFYHKNNTYPVSLEQLESTNNLRFLRKRFKDPMTASGEWKLIHLGEAQLTLPAGAGTTAPGTPGTPGPTGQTGTLNSTNPFAGTPSPSPSPGGFGASLGLSAPGPGGQQQGGNPPGTSQLGTLTVQNSGSGGGPIIGVASTSKKTSIKEFNGNSEYDQWLFVYDPRWEQVPGSGGVIIAGPAGSNSSTGAPSGTVPGTTGAPGTQPPLVPGNASPPPTGTGMPGPSPAPN